VASGQPIRPLPNEQRLDSRHSLLIYSPQPKFHDYIGFESPDDVNEWHDEDERIDDNREDHDL